MQRKVLKSGLMLSAMAAPAIIHNAAYANTLTRLIPDLYAAVDVISRELVGFIPTVTRNAEAARAAVGQDVVYPISGDTNEFDVTPAMNVPEPADFGVTNGVIKITKSKGVEFGWVGEEQRGLNTGVGYLSIQANNFAQGVRRLTNLIERDLAVEAALNASRAHGTSGTTPFGTDLSDTAQLRKILDDNGAPLTGRAALIDTAAGASLRTLQNLTRVNEAGTSMTLRDGELLNIHGFSIHESAAVQPVAAGTAAGYTTDGAAQPVGATLIPYATPTGAAGTFLPGDVITIAGDPNRYVIASVAAGVITIHEPGLREPLAAGAAAITVAATGTPNVGFSPDAIHLVARAPALPQEGDLAMDRMMITDPRSGMSYEVSLYPGYRKVRAEVAIAWGVKAVKPAHIAMLRG